MKHLFRTLALVLALTLALSAALAEAVPASADPVLFTFDGEEITQSQVDDALYNMLMNGYVEDESDYDTAIQALIQDRVLQAKIAQLGLDQFTPEEEEALRADAQQEWDDALDYYVSYFLAEDTDEARAQARQQAIAYYNMNGFDVDVLFDNAKKSASYDKLEAHILENVEIAVTDEEIQSVFDLYAEGDRDAYADSIQMYEIYTNYYGYESWYVPAGYRGIIHILLSVDDELLTAYQDAQVAFEEAEGEEAPDQAKIDAAKAAVDAARQAVLDSKKDAIDDIYARLEKGEEFTALIAAYGEDPGMENEAYLNNGYEVHAESVVYDPVFVAAAFSEKMVKPGDVSDPVVGSYGIHILYYLRDIPEGIVELSDEIRAEIEEYIRNSKTSDALNEAVDAWTGEHEIVYNEEAIAAAKNQAQAE